MKTAILLLSITTMLIFVSCNNSENQNNQNSPQVEKTEKNDVQTNGLIGKWVLISRENEAKEIEKFNDSPADLILEFGKNGYFQVYDKIKRMKNPDVMGYVNRRKSGQWSATNTEITFSFVDSDTTVQEIYTIIQASETELKVKRTVKNTTITETYYRK